MKNGLHFKGTWENSTLKSWNSNVMQLFLFISITLRLLPRMKRKLFGCPKKKQYCILSTKLKWLKLISKKIIFGIIIEEIVIIIVSIQTRVSMQLTTRYFLFVLPVLIKIWICKKTLSSIFTNWLDNILLRKYWAFLQRQE